jgi:hypothetical protein
MGEPEPTALEKRGPGANATHRDRVANPDGLFLQGKLECQCHPRIEKHSLLLVCPVFGLIPCLRFACDFSVLTPFSAMA